jgi:hypothetical protein
MAVGAVVFADIPVGETVVGLGILVGVATFPLVQPETARQKAIR